MVNKKLGVKSAKELNGATVCVQPGTTTELNLADYFRANKMKFKPVVIEKIEEVRAAFFAGRCDVFTTDASGLYADARRERRRSRTTTSSCRRSSRRSRWDRSVRHGDDQFARHRALDALRHARGRGIRHHLEERRRDAEERQSRDQAHPRRHAGHGQGARGRREVGLQHHQAGRQLRRGLRPQRRHGLAPQDRPRPERAVDARAACNTPRRSAKQRTGRKRQPPPARAAVFVWPLQIPP